MARALKVYQELFDFDAEVRTHFPVICGVDEAGRGPLAGDVYAAAVILKPDTVIDRNITLQLNASGVPRPDGQSGFRAVIRGYSVPEYGK